MPIQKNSSTSVTLDGRDYIYFGGTNYLGLAHRPELLRAATEAFNQYGFSAGASRLTSGENELILALEQELSETLESRGFHCRSSRLRIESRCRRGSR